MSADPVIQDIASAIHVRHIQTPIDQACPFTTESTQATVHEHLVKNKFDATPIFGTEPWGPLKGWVRQDDLDPGSDSPLGEVRRELVFAVLIDGHAPLSDLLGRFARGDTFLFVVGGPGVTGLVTPSDLNRQAGRTHLFLEVSALELAMAQALRQESGDQKKWLEYLHPKRARNVRKLQTKKQDEDQGVDLIACLHFKDLLIIHRRLGVIGGEWLKLNDRSIDTLANFRNSLMHAVENVTTDHMISINQLITNTNRISRLLTPFLDQDKPDQVSIPTR